MSPPQY